MLPTIAIIGRPNVGKSTLFNRLLRKGVAITHDLPGVTRDRIAAEAKWRGRSCILIDTGGLTLDVGDKVDEFHDEVFMQVNEAMNEAQVILFLVDGREGLNPLDEQVAALIRKRDADVHLIVNKIDGEEMEAQGLSEFHALGFPVHPVSAAHGYNLQPLRDHLAELLEKFPEEDERDALEAGLKVAVLGRPNAGKSSTVNALIGENRLIVSPVAGTTRDSVDVTIELDGKRFTFVDTAGIRRRTHISDPVEQFSVMRALKVGKSSDAVILVMDAIEGVTRQDKRLLALLDKEKTPFIVAVNKVDLVPRQDMEEMRNGFKEALRICPHVPVVYTSALNRTNLPKLLPMCETLHKECSVRIGTGQLNRALEQVLERHQPPVIKGRRAKFYYLTQADVMPPTFVFFVNDPNRVRTSYARYLENGLRRIFDLKIAPMRVVFRPSHEKKTQGEKPRSGKPRGGKTQGGKTQVGKKRGGNPQGQRSRGGKPQGKARKGSQRPESGKTP